MASLQSRLFAGPAAYRPALARKAVQPDGTHLRDAPENVAWTSGMASMLINDRKANLKAT